MDLQGILIVIAIGMITSRNTHWVAVSQVTGTCLAVYTDAEFCTMV